MDTTDCLLMDLYAKGNLIGKDLIVHDDNGYYRGHIVSAPAGLAPEEKIIRLYLSEATSERFDPQLGVISTPIALEYFCIEQSTTYRMPDHEVIAIYLSVSGEAFIVSENAPIPDYA